MLDIDSAIQSAPAASQLAVNGYFDERIFELETMSIFAAGWAAVAGVLS